LIAQLMFDPNQLQTRVYVEILQQ